MNAARMKVETEGACRVCGDENVEHLDAAHLLPRSMGGGGFDEPNLIVPLCSRIKGGGGCHDDFDEHKLDLLPYVRRDEEVALVRLVGIERARVRLTGGTEAWRNAEGEPF